MLVSCDLEIENAAENATVNRLTVLLHAHALQSKKWRTADRRQGCEIRPVHDPRQNFEKSGLTLAQPTLNAPRTAAFR